MFFKARAEHGRSHCTYPARPLARCRSLATARPARTLSFACYCGLLLLLDVGRSSFLLIRGVVPRTQLAQLRDCTFPVELNLRFPFYLAQVWAMWGTTGGEQSPIGN